MSMTHPKVLLAEPHKELREALEEALGDVFEILPARTVSGAALGFERHQPPAVLIAMKQSEGNGLELCQKLRSNAAHRAYIVVYGTMPDLDEEVLSGDIRKRYGCDRYMPRGVTIKRLHELLTTQLRLGWRAMDSGPVLKEVDTSEPPPPRWSHPMTSTDVVSAKREEEETSSGIFRRIFKR